MLREKNINILRLISFTMRLKKIFYTEILTVRSYGNICTFDVNADSYILVMLPFLLIYSILSQMVPKQINKCRHV